MEKKKRVAVIGAGICGVIAMRSVLEEDMEPVCFERTGHHGGLWRYHDEDVEGLASVMRTTVISNSKEIGCLSNRPVSADLPNYLNNREVYQNVQQMIAENDMFRYIRYNKEVVKVEFAGDYQETGRYKVTVTDRESADVETDTFDGVFVCIGHHVYPNWVTFPGQDKFKGRIIHTHSLKNTDGYRNKNVVVVGIGNSGADAAVEIGSESKQVYLSTRRGAWIFPRIGPRGVPTDVAFNRRCFYILQQLLPYHWFCWIAEQFIQTQLDHSMYNLKPKHRILSQHPTINDGLPFKLLSGAVVVRGNIKRFTEDGVIFDGEEKVTPVDEVVLATGYHINFPFLDKEITSVKDNQVDLYKFIYPSHLPHPTLAVLGLVQSIGAGHPVFEAQSRLAAYALSGRIKLPNRVEMEADIAARKRCTKRRYVDSPRHTVECDFVGYLDEVNELFGAKPNFLKMFFTDPRLWWALMFGPHLAYQYRLQGPHPWLGAREAIFTSRNRMLKPLQSGRKDNEITESRMVLTKQILGATFFVIVSLLCFVFP